MGVLQCVPLQLYLNRKYINTGWVGFMGSLNPWNVFPHRRPFYGKCITVNTFCVSVLFLQSLYIGRNNFSIYWNIHAKAVIAKLTFCFQVDWWDLVTWLKTHFEKSVSHLVFVTEWASSLPRKWQDCLQMSASLLSVRADMTALSVWQQRAATCYFYQIIIMGSKSIHRVANTAAHTVVKHSNLY